MLATKLAPRIACLKQLQKSCVTISPHAFNFSSQKPNQTDSDSEPQPYVPSEGSDTDYTDAAEQYIRPKIDPVQGHLTNFLDNFSVYEEQNLDVENSYFMDTRPLKGFATTEGTNRFYRRAMNEDSYDVLEVSPYNFNSPFDENLKVSSIGYGTYVGDPDDMTDFQVYDAIKQSVLSGGVNHIDTAPNYRYMKAEKTVGKILTALESKYGIDREYLFITSKAGYVPEDAEKEITQREMIETLIRDYEIPQEEIVPQSGHCLYPAFLKKSIEDSLYRLNLECLDVLYLHNPYEAQGPHNTDNVFFDRLYAAFELLEQMVEEGKIKQYGLATYSSMRLKPTENKMHLNLQKVARLAQKVVGEDKEHNFKFVQVPCNVMMPEAFVEPWQPYEDSKGVVSNKQLVQSATEQRINVVFSQPLMQGMISQIPISRVAVPEVYNLTARHLQLIRSVPAKAVLSTLVGMKQPNHVKANLEVIKKPPLTRYEFLGAIKPVRRTEFIEEELDM